MLVEVTAIIENPQAEYNPSGEPVVDVVLLREQDASEFIRELVADTRREPTFDEDGTLVVMLNADQNTRLTITTVAIPEPPIDRDTLRQMGEQ